MFRIKAAKAATEKKYLRGIVEAELTVYEFTVELVNQIRDYD